MRLLIDPRRLRQLRLGAQLPLFGGGTSVVHQHVRHQGPKLVVVQQYARHVDTTTAPQYAHGVGGPKAAPTEVPVSESSKTTTETRMWNKATTGYRTGQTVQLGGDSGPWVTVTSAGEARTGKLTQQHEDMGHGMAGATRTSQQITHRPATPEEIAAAQAKREAAAQAKREADPGYHQGLFMRQPGAVTHAEAGPRDREIAAMPLTWRDVARTPNGPAWQEATGPDGRKFGRYTSGWDDYRTFYSEVVPQDEAATRAAAEAAAKRANAFDGVRKYGLESMLKPWAHPTIVSDPQTDDEHAAVAEGKAVDARHAAHRARLSAIEASGIMTPEDMDALTPDRANTDLDSAGPLAAQLNRQYNTDRTRTHDLAVAHGLALLDPTKRKHAPRTTPWDSLLPKASLGLPNQTWDYITQLETLATSRGTYPHYAAQFAAAKTATVAERLRFISSKKDKTDLARKVAEPTAHPIDVAAWQQLPGAADIAATLPKKVQDQLRAAGRYPG